MPLKNHFQHQSFTADEPAVAWRLMSAPKPPPENSDAYVQSVRDFMNSASDHVDAIWLVHGTFVGNDALGIFGQIERAVPALGPALKQFGKKLTDALAGDTGNFNRRFVEHFESVQQPESADQACPIRRFTWSGENTHSGRCKAAIELLARLLEHMDAAGAERVLLWGHSHAGNIAALITNLLGAEPWCRASFFELVKPLFPNSHGEARTKPNDLQKVKQAFETGQLPGKMKLDIVNFGTPVSYGWDVGGYRRLLHLVNHQCQRGQPDWLSPPVHAAGRWLFASRSAENSRTTTGDVVQIMGISGSEFLPWLLDQQTRDCETALQLFVAPGNSRANYWEHVRVGMRVAREGTSLLIDYDPTVGMATAALGHAIYTQSQWLSFHCDVIRECFYTE